MLPVGSLSGYRCALRIKLLLFVALGSTIVSAIPPSGPRIHSYVDDSERFTLRGNTRPVVEQAIARREGRLSSSFLLPHMVLHFAMTPAQQADLAQLIKDQQDRRSPQYHRFLTPEEYAARFGLADADIAKIVHWLHEKGFSDEQVAQSKTWVSFSGTAAHAESAFHISLHRYQLNGETHYANTGDPQLPKVLEGVVEGVRGFHNFGMKPFARRAHPNFTLWGGNTHYLAPDDWGTIYDVKPLYGAGIDGSGVTIAVVGQSDVHLSDLQAFRAASGLPPKDPTIIVPPGLQDPGIQKSSGDEVESDLDLEWAGAIARNAEIVFVTASGTAGSGVEDALTYAIDHNVAPIISTSYGLCEADESTTGVQSMNSLFQQANAQGITIVAASGDSGPAACDTAPNESVASRGYAVTFPASSAYVTGVGGTIFSESGTENWAAANNGASGSALAYIPEAAWDDGAQALYEGAGGGGASALFSKPAWQTGTGVPADNFRDVPDLAFSASAIHDGYLICSEGSCHNGFFDNNNNVFAIGGTSAPTPSFAGVLALVIQQHGGGGGRLGNINPNLYSLAQFSTNIFHDVTAGSNNVTCESTTTSCPQPEIGFAAGVGYDQATGWGSLDVNQFAEQWYGDFQISVNPTSLTLQRGSSGTASVTLTPQNNFNGPVTFSCSVPASLADVSCSLPSNTLNGSGTTTITITAATTARSPWWKNIRLRPSAGERPILATALLVIMLAMVMTLATKWRLRPRLYGTGLVAGFAFAIVTISCGGSSSSSSSGSGSGNGTTPPPVPKLTLSCDFGSTVTANVADSFQCAASGGTGAYTFNVISGTLPAGLALNPYTGMISGTPATAGTYSFTVQVTDSGSPQQSASYAETNLVIGPYVKPLDVVCNLPAGAVTGANYSGSCSASGGLPLYTYSISAGSLPAGLIMNSYTGAISGMPTVAGTSSFTVQVADSWSPPQTASQTIGSFSVGIGPLSSLSCSLPAGSGVAKLYKGQCSAAGGTPPFTYAVTNGTLPQGLTLDRSTGIVSGIPPVPTNFDNFTITVSDSSTPAQTASQALQVNIYPVSPVSLSCPATAAASPGVAYINSCFAANGNYPFMWSIVSGQLPPGIQLDSTTGTISGTPTEVGTYSFTVQVVDSSVPAGSSRANGSITVGPRPSENGVVTITATSGGIVTTATLQVAVP